jgi:hypothetical protein
MHVHRTKRGRILEYWVLFFLSVRPYRCGKCRLRFYGPKKFDDGDELRDVPDPVAADEATHSSRGDSEPSRSSGH